MNLEFPARSTDDRSWADRFNVDDTRNGVSLSGAFLLSTLLRNTVDQTNTSWFANDSGAFAVLVSPGTQAKFYVRSTATQGRRCEKGSRSCGPQPTFIIVPWGLALPGTAVR